MPTKRPPIWDGSVARDSDTGVPVADVHENLVASRGAEYGDSYQLTDAFIREYADRIALAPSPFSFIMVHNKLMRALTSPAKQDHYDDIIGYCKLLLREIEASRQEEAEGVVRHWLHEKP